MINWNKPIRLCRNTFWNVLSVERAANWHSFGYYIVTVVPSETNKLKHLMSNKSYVVDHEGKILGDKMPFVENITKYKVTSTCVYYYDSKEKAKEHMAKMNGQHKMETISD